MLVLSGATSTGEAHGRFLIRASKPFAIVAIEGAGNGFEVAASDPGPKTVHILTVRYRPGASAPDDSRRTFRVLTDLPGEPPLELTAILRAGP